MCQSFLIRMDSIGLHGVCVCVLGAFEAFPTNGLLDNVCYLMRAVYGVSPWIFF